MRVLVPPLESVRTHETKRLALCYRIERETDSQVIRVTNARGPLVVRTGDPATFETFSPTNCSSEAWTTESGSEPQNGSIFGFVDDSVFSLENFRIGLWDNAEVRVFIVDWRYPWLGYLRKDKFWIGDIQWSDTIWEATLVGIPGQAVVKVGRLWQRECDARLGDERCGKDISSMGSGTRTVTQVSGLSEGDAPRLRFYSNTSQADNYYKFGRLRWLTGNNAITGLNGYDVKVYKLSNGKVELWTETFYDIEVGDTFEMDPGCNRRFQQHCKKKFNNAAAFRGEPGLQDSDSILRKPVSK